MVVEALLSHSFVHLEERSSLSSPLTLFCKMALICADGHLIPLYVPCNDDGVGSVEAALLSVRFNLVVESLHSEEEVYNVNSQLSHTVY